MKWIVFLLVVSPPVFAADYIIGGQSVGPSDPIAASTVGIFTPNPGQSSGALCSGTLIGKDIAVTAAHCIDPGSKPVVIFNRDLHKGNAIHERADAVSVNPIWHKKAGRGMDQGDIALVKFHGPLPRGYKTVPTVTSDSAIPQKGRVILAGYGISNAQTKTGAGKLRKTSVAIENSRPGKTEMILDQTHGHGACHGDSGGPAFLRRGKNIALAGVTNRGTPDGSADDCAHKVVYTKVPAYRSWIAKNEKKLEAGGPSTYTHKVKLKAARQHTHGIRISHNKKARTRRAFIAAKKR